MILKSLLFGALGLASLPNQATAQYVNHLQKYYRYDPSAVANNPLNERRLFDTKALTRVNNGDELPKWTFVTTATGPASGDTAGKLFMVITRLKANLPDSDSFRFEDSKEYKFAPTNPNTKLTLMNIDVMDIVHAEGQGYIACGKVVTTKSKSYGFMLRINENLNPGQARLYREVEVFNSCGFWHKESKGFVAVGASPTNDPKNEGRQAIFMSVKKNLNSVVCALNVTGTFPVPHDYYNDNQFNKVIKYSKTNTRLHAMVGTTQSYNIDDRRCTEDKDVLVMVLNEKCQKQKVFQYGERTIRGQIGYNEEGFALTGFKEGEPKGLVITGNVQKTEECKKVVRYDDTLVFRLKQNLSLIWFWRYDIYSQFSSTMKLIDTPDFGTAILMNDQALPIYGSDVPEKNNILVAGETTTPFFSTQIDATDQLRDTQDAFVLELKPSDGTVLKNEIFGLKDDAQNGVLRDGLLDMHLTQDGHAVVMGNVRLFPESDTTPINPKKPYLIERYDTIGKDTKDCSVRKDIENQEIKLNLSDVRTVKIKPKAINFKLKKKPKKWKEEVTCEKIGLDVVGDDIFEDDIFEDDIFEDDIIVEDDIIIVKDDIVKEDDFILAPTPKPTLPKLDDIISFPDDKLVFEEEFVGPGSF